MINNIADIIDLLKFETPDDFYHLQILKRKKEHPDLGSNSYVVKTYYVSSVEYLNKKIPEIIALCNFHEARAYINLNVRSFERTAFQTLKKVTDQLMNKDYKSVRKAYESVCGEFASGRDKVWIIDIDEKGLDIVNQIYEYTEGLMPDIGKSKVIGILPTKNGNHILTKPFNLQDFAKDFPGIDVHKNNGTILFIP